MIDHWWWRPGWAVGRQFYTWHLTFDNAPEAARLVEKYRPHLDLPSLDLIPQRWLHLTMQGIGFVGEVDEADIDKIVTAAGVRLAALEPFTVSLGPTVVDPEVVRLQVNPAGPVRHLRRELRAAIADVWGTDSVPEDADDFTPHVSLAYSNSEGDMQPVLDAAGGAVSGSARCTIGHADLIMLNRDHRQYEWTTYAEVPLRASGI